MNDDESPFASEWTPPEPLEPLSPAFDAELEEDKAKRHEALEELRSCPPAELVEAMIADRLLEVISCLSVSDFLTADDNPGPWFAAALAFHEQGHMSRNAYLALLGDILEIVAEPLAARDAEVRRLDAELELISLFGPTDWSVDPDLEQLAEEERLSELWCRRRDVVMAVVLRDHGLDVSAALLALPTNEWDDRVEAGQFEWEYRARWNGLPPMPSSGVHVEE